MDGIPRKVRFNYKIDDESIDSHAEHWQIYLLISGRFSIEVFGRVWFQEVHVPLVELGVQLSKWIREAGADDFEYESMEAAEGALFRFSRVEDGWRMYSSSAEFRCMEVFTFEELKCEAENYLASLLLALWNEYSIDISGLLSGRIKV